MRDYHSILTRWEDYNFQPQSESDLGAAKIGNVLDVCNMLLRSERQSWKGKTALGGNRLCDFALRTGGGIEIAGKMKGPLLDLETSLTSSCLTAKLNSDLGTPVAEEEMKPYLLLFSHMIKSRRYMGILSTYDHIRCFMID